MAQKNLAKQHSRYLVKKLLLEIKNRKHTLLYLQVCDLLDSHKRLAIFWHQYTGCNGLDAFYKAGYPKLPITNYNPLYTKK